MSNREISSKGKIYLAGPLFCQGEKDFNLAIAKMFESEGYSVFLPQRDGYEAAEMVDKDEQEKTKLIFDEDVSEILKADILVMVLDSRVPDDGACVELGIAYANKKRCYGLKTDVRSIEIGMDLNPMLAGCFTKNYDGNALIKDIREYLQSNSL